MKTIVYADSSIPSQAAIEKLYNDVGWINYTKDMTSLMEGIKNSLFVITAWDHEELVGLMRGVGDRHTILYMQDILVCKAYQRQHIAQHMMQRAFAAYGNVRQIVLLSDDSVVTKSFYSSCGFINSAVCNTIAYIKM